MFPNLFMEFYPNFRLKNLLKNLLILF